MSEFKLKRRSKESYKAYVQGFKAAVGFMEKQVKKGLSIEEAVTQMRTVVNVMEATVKLLEKTPIEDIPLEVKEEEEDDYGIWRKNERDH